MRDQWYVHLHTVINPIIRKIEFRNIKVLKHYLRHYLTIRFRVIWTLSKKASKFLRFDSHLLVEAKTPYFWHIFPAVYCIGWVRFQLTSLLHCCVPKIGIFSISSNLIYLRSSNNSREDSFWGILSTNSCFTHACNSFLLLSVC